MSLLIINVARTSGRIPELCVLPIKVFVYIDILMIMGTRRAVNKYQETCLVVMSRC